MGLRLWMDDMRHPPLGYAYDLWAKTAKEAIELIDKGHALITHCSLDHDLAEEHYDDANSTLPIDRLKYKELTGLAVIQWMAQSNIWVPSIYIHTLNDMGAQEMLSLIREKAPGYVKAERRHPKDTRPPERT